MPSVSRFDLIYVEKRVLMNFGHREKKMKKELIYYARTLVLGKSQG